MLSIAVFLGLVEVALAYLVAKLGNFLLKPVILSLHV